MIIYHFKTFLYAVDSDGKKHQICYDERKLDEKGFSEIIRIDEHECKVNYSLTGEWTMIGNGLPEVDTGDLQLTLQGQTDTKAYQMLQLCHLEHLPIKCLVWVVAHAGVNNDVIEAECHKITADQHQYERIILNDRTIKKAALEDTASSLANFLITH